MFVEYVCLSFPCFNENLYTFIRMFLEGLFLLGLALLILVTKLIRLVSVVPLARS